MNVLRRLLHSEYRYLAVIWLWLSVAYFIFGTYRNYPYKIEADGKYYYVYLVSLALDGDIDFTDDYRTPRYPWMAYEVDSFNQRSILSATGKPLNVFSIGPAILWSPFWVIAFASAALLNAANIAAIPLDGWSRYFQYITMYGTVVYAISALYLMHRIIRQYFDGFATSLAVTTTFFCGSAVYYAIFEPSYSHIPDLFSGALFVFLYLKALNNPHRRLLFVAPGLAGGLHVLVRPQNVVTVAVFFLFLLRALLRDSRQSGRWMPAALNAAAAGVGLFAAMLPLLLANHYLFGTPFIVPQGPAFLRWTRMAIGSVLFSGRNGLFSHHPVLLIGLIGTAAMAVKGLRDRNVSVLALILPLIISFGLQVYINSAAHDWWGGDAFGQRRLIGIYLVFGVGFAQMIVWLASRTSRKALEAVTVILVILNLYLMFIHVFMWPYDQPHNILLWMFYEAPRLIWHAITHALN